VNIKDLDGNIHSWQLTGNMAHGKTANRSSLHLRARALLILIFPTLQILEEVPILLRRSETLYLDFYLPLNKTCIEVHGEQHYKFIPHYHNTLLGFMKHKKRDKDKLEWCDINQIKYIELPFNETDEEWSKRIQA
jgi:hypothetical protein